MTFVSKEEELLLSKVSAWKMGKRSAEIQVPPEQSYHYAARL